jgi:hypothetical protein
MSTATDRLYNLLPVLYRQRDADHGQSLRALLGIIDGELAQVETDISGLYENWFIETSDEWVVPYIGDLLGVRGLNTLRNSSFSQRAYVANTLFYRRRKGTAYVLGKLAKDVTGWPAHVVEFFELLQTTQYLNHLRPFNSTPDLRQVNQLNLLDTPFDSLPHTADVRHIYNRRGKHNIPNLGIFLWRLQNYPLLHVVARQAESAHSYGYHFSSLGNPAPLFNYPGGTGFPSEQQVPAPIRPYDFFLDLKTYQAAFSPPATPPDNSRYYGPQRSLQIVKDGSPVAPMDVMCKDLSTWEQPPAGKVAVDVTLGRIAFPTGEEPAHGLKVSYNYGFSADIGGGPYDRRERITPIHPPILEFPVGPGKTYATLDAALADWAKSRPPAVIRIYDSATYYPNLTIDLPKNGMLVIDCENEVRPTLITNAPLKVTSAATTRDEIATLTLSGLLIEGDLEVSGKLNLTLTDCTLVPGLSLDEDGYPIHPDLASLTVSGTDVADTSIIISRSILGPLQLPEECQGLVIRDSLVDAPTARDQNGPTRAAIAADPDAIGSGPVTSLERVTVFGRIHVRELSLASEVIFTDPVVADRRQAGCVRFSSIADGSKTPRRFRCQPNLALAKQEQLEALVPLPADEYETIKLRLRPAFTSQRYGQPAFGQLASSCADEIKAGAEDGSEMGAFSLLQQPQRQANLQVTLGEYLRFGLEAGIIFVT